MILDYFECPVAYSRLITLLGTCDFGTPAENIGRLEDLSSSIEATDHALVVVGIDDDAFYVNDPYLNQAPQRVPRIHFELAWFRFDNLCAVITI